MYYADWCGNCTSLKPIFKPHADETERLSKEGRSYFADFYMVSDEDMTRGAAPRDIHITGFPTFVFRTDSKIVNVIVGKNPDALNDQIQKLQATGTIPATNGGQKRPAVDMRAFGSIMSGVH
jgi:thiol-disulfide isomerase/thioredoxin